MRIIYHAKVVINIYLFNFLQKNLITINKFDAFFLKKKVIVQCKSSIIGGFWGKKAWNFGIKTCEVAKLRSYKLTPPLFEDINSIEIARTRHSSSKLDSALVGSQFSPKTGEEYVSIKTKKPRRS